MALDSVQGPDQGDPEDLLVAWRGQVRELESLPEESADAGGELLTQLRAIADDLARGPAQSMALLPAASDQAEVLSEAIAQADAAPPGEDTLIVSPLDFAALTTAIATLEGAASTVLARAEGEFADVRESVRSEVLAIRETLTSELNQLRDEFQRSHRRAARRSTDTGSKVSGPAIEAPLLARLNDACAQLETLCAHTQRIADALPQPSVPSTDQAPEATEALAELHQFVQTAVVSLRHDLDAYAPSVEAQASEVRRSADLSTTAAEQAIAQLQERVVAAVGDADQRLARLTANVQSTVERAERSASQVEAAFAATAALRAEASTAAGNWRDEALRIVRDALARMATETAGAANQAREARKTVIAETRTLRSELLKDAESAHAAVLAEVRRELEHTRAAFAEQRQQLANELSALEEARRRHDQLAAESRGDVSRAVADSASTTRLEVERLDAAYRDLRAHLEEVRAANTRVVAAVESVEARANAELEPLAAARQHSEELSAALRDEIAETLAELREARAELEDHHGSAIDSIAATHNALTAEMARTLDGAREQLVAAHVDLRRHVDEVRTANDLVVNLAEGVETSVNAVHAAKDQITAAAESMQAQAKAHLEPLASVRERSEQLVNSLRAEIGETLTELRGAHAELEEQHRSAIDMIAATQVGLTVETEHVASARDQLSAAHRDLRRHLDDVRAANELVVNTAKSVEASLKAEIAPLAELRRQSQELTASLREQIGSVVTDLDETRARVDGTDEDLRAGFRELASRLDDVRTANDRLVAAADSMESRADAELGHLAVLRQSSQGLVDSLRTEIESTLAGLRDAQGDLDEQQRSTTDSIAATQATLTTEVKHVALTREGLSAAHRELLTYLDDARAANQLVLNVAEAVESSVKAEIQPIAEVRRESQKLSVALQRQVNEALLALEETRARVEDTDDELRTTCQQLASAGTDVRDAREELSAAEQELSAASERIAASTTRLDTAADVVLHRATDVQRLHAAFAEFHAHLQETREELRAANELVVRAAETVESRANAELAPLAEVRARSEELARTFGEVITAVPQAVHAKIDAAVADLSTATRGIDRAEERLNAAAKSAEARVRAEIDALAHSRSEYEAAIERFRDDSRTSLDDARAHHERTAASLAKEFRSIAEQRRAEFSRMFEDMRGQFGEALSAIAASNAEAKADANAHISGLAHDLRTAIEQQVRAASHEIRAELAAVVNALREQLDRATVAEREAAALHEAAESRQARDDDDALQRAIAMLSVLESLDDALQGLQSEQTPEARARIDHFERQARAMAELVELEEIPSHGDIDEERHEIVGVDANQGELGRIVAVRQRGYAFRGRIIRRAQVVVSGASAGVTRARAAAELRS